MNISVTKGQYLDYKKFLKLEERFYNKVKGRRYLRFKRHTLIPDGNVSCDFDLRDVPFESWRKVLPTIIPELDVLYK